ncbi:Peroxisomal biogenesis factor 19 [Zalerion maritima]|uniref:Peroxisomal biogenesis factor 19 n=1 Tax=Zalerion maritima TaxID=339359 RepID=A0AAD5WUF8_9PEZI|nr:Peroxisomal biogenesis factor 19 [Zalerion maritima]
MEGTKGAAKEGEEQPKAGVEMGAPTPSALAAPVPDTTVATGKPQPQPAKVEDDIADPDEDFPDPDEDFPDDDDLDDLDDELDQFIAPPKPTMGPPRPLDSGQGKETSGEGPEEEAMPDEDFTKDFTNEMRKLMKELDDSPEMQSQLEGMFSTIQKAAEEDASADAAAGVGGAPRAPGADAGLGVGEPSSSRPGTSASSTAPKASFKDTIAGLTDQLKTSDKTTKDNLASGLGAGSDEEAMLNQLLQNLPLGALGGEGGGSEDDFTNMLLGMMEQLTAKEILYDPMKELSQSFPGWIEKNKEKVPEEEIAKHKEQLKLVNEIVAMFEEPGYADDDAERRKYIVDRMQSMQATGAVPPDLLGDSPSMQDAFGANGGCDPQ